MTREELDAAWDAFHREHLSSGGAIAECAGLVDMERAHADRAAIARAIRWAANQSNGAVFVGLFRMDLRELAHRVESGEVEVPT